MKEDELALKELKEKYASLKDKFALVASILSAQVPESEERKHLKTFQDLLRNDFTKEFSAKEDTMTADAEALLRLQEVEKELKEIVDFPMLSTKNIVAVAGKFSSGKSKFLNTTIHGGGIQLSVGVKSTTAIPTFVLFDETAKITAYTPDGRQGEVPVELFNKIDHGFIEEIGFNLKTIMPYVTVFSAFCEKLSDLNNLCFIDTPGYDAVNDEDKETTFDVLQFTSSVVWFVAINNGTLNKNDVDFLQSLNNKGKKKKLYVVVSKADLQKSSIQTVINRIKSDLEDNDIPFVGISAFSSNENKEYKDEEMQTSIYDFLIQQNENVVDTAERFKELKSKIDSVFQLYYDSIANDLARIKKTEKDVRQQQKKIEETMEKKDQEIAKSKSSGYYQSYMRRGLFGGWGLNSNENTKENDKEEDNDIDFFKFIENDKKRIEHNKKNDETARRLCRKMKDSVDNIFKELNREAAQKAKYKIFCDKCGTKLQTRHKFCPGCGESIVID